MAGNVNAHSFVWNSHCHRRKNAIFFKKLIKEFRLLINNKPERATCTLIERSQLLILLFHCLNLARLPCEKFQKSIRHYLIMSF